MVFFQNLHIKHQIKLNVHLMINYIRKNNENNNNIVVKNKIQNVLFEH